MAFFVTLDSDLCSHWNSLKGLFVTRLATPLYLTGDHWHVALLDYNIQADLLLHSEDKPIYIQTDIVEPQLVCTWEDRVLHVGPLQKFCQPTHLRFKKVSVPQIDTVTIQLLNSSRDPFRLLNCHLLINLVFQQIQNS